MPFIDSDLRCQAELARYRRLLRGARARCAPPTWSRRPGGLAQTLNALAAEGERRVARGILSGRRVVVAGAALGGAAVGRAPPPRRCIAARSRRRLLAG